MILGVLCMSVFNAPSANAVKVQQAIMPLPCTIQQVQDGSRTILSTSPLTCESFLESQSADMSNEIFQDGVPELVASQDNLTQQLPDPVNAEVITKMRYLNPWWIPSLLLTNIFTVWCVSRYYSRKLSRS